MFSTRRGVLVALIIGVIVGAIASATILSASSHGSVAHGALHAQQRAQTSWSGT